MGLIKPPTATDIPPGSVRWATWVNEQIIKTQIAQDRQTQRIGNTNKASTSWAALSQQQQAPIDNSIKYLSSLKTYTAFDATIIFSDVPNTPLVLETNSTPINFTLEDTYMVGFRSIATVETAITGLVGSTISSEVDAYIVLDAATLPNLSTVSSELTVPDMGTDPLLTYSNNNKQSLSCFNSMILGPGDYTVCGVYQSMTVGTSSMVTLTDRYFEVNILNKP